MKNVVRFHTFTSTFSDEQLNFRFPGFPINDRGVGNWRRLLRRSRSLSPILREYEYLQFSIREWRANGDHPTGGFSPSGGYYVDSLVLWRINEVKSGGASSQEAGHVVLGQYPKRESAAFSNFYILEDVIYKIALISSGSSDEIWINQQTTFGSHRHWVCGIQDITGIKGLAADE